MAGSTRRCSWCGDDPQYQHYHDSVWGVPERQSQELFKRLCLEGQQAGLSWITILRKQDSYESAFFDFNAQKMAAMGERDIQLHMRNKGIVRNRLKIRSLISNARAYVKFEHGGGYFADYLWSFVGNTPVQNAFVSLADVPAQTEVSRAMSVGLKALGFNFVGPTICYAFMQSCGMVNDHLLSCECYKNCWEKGQSNLFQ